MESNLTTAYIFELGWFNNQLEHQNGNFPGPAEKSFRRFYLGGGFIFFKNNFITLKKIARKWNPIQPEHIFSLMGEQKPSYTPVN